MKKRMQFMEGQRADVENYMSEQNTSDRNIPARVAEWLEDVKKIKEDVDKIGCFNIKKKYRAGKNALKLIEDIEGFIKESSDIILRDARIPLGRVDFKRLASTSGGGTQNLFNSRVKMFNEALKLLQQADDDAARVIALCGMGGVGKTTLMNQLKEAAHDNKMFNWIVVVVIGNTPNLFAIQKAIAAHIGEPLTETDEILRATYLSKRFKGFAERKEKILVILDDVWEAIRLENIGLGSPLPDGVKLLLTSRNVNICRWIAVDAYSALEVIRVDVLEEEEAGDFLCQITGISAEHDRDLYRIGCDIVKKCGFLPLAIKLIATTLKYQNESVWRHKLDRLKKNDLDENVQEIIEISYKNLKQEQDKAIFLLCGLFPEGSNIPIEDLTRYAWGLKLLNKVYTMEDARHSIKTSVSNLKNAHLLMDGDSCHCRCVKMNDLVLAFVVYTVSKGGEDGCWIIHHDDFSKFSEADNKSESCKQISLTCKGMSEFPIDFKFPNIRVLKLMQGDESLSFPQDLYEGMETLQVIAFEKLDYPIVPTSFQFSANLRTLCLDKCSLTFDLTCIGNLSNLEVLSLANSGITILPSTFRNLMKLRLLDLTNFYNLVISDGVLKSLVKLEELYMGTIYNKASFFTDGNCSELAERSKNLHALEFEFVGNNAHMKNMSYKRLQRFKLSVGCYFSEVRNMLYSNQVDTHLYRNSLKLITNSEELLKSKINELFKITEALYLQVNDMNTLEDVDVESPHPRQPLRYSSFYNLRFLVVSECAELKYLLTPSVAATLSKLECLEISRCPIMEFVIHTENNGSEILKFSNLKYLSLVRLPKLLHLCNNVNVIELPSLVELQLEGLPNITSIYPNSATSSVSSYISSMQSFLDEEVATPKLERLLVFDMENLKEIWPPQFNISNVRLLRELEVGYCGSIEVLLNMDFGEIEHLSSSLRSIKVKKCDSIVKLFSCNPFPFLNNLQELDVRSCGSVQVLFDTDLGCAGKVEEKVCSSSLRSIQVEYCYSLVNLLPTNPMPLFNHLEKLTVKNCPSIEVLFNIDMDEVSSSRLKSIHLNGLWKLREVWRIKDSGNNLIHGFEALESIRIEDCERFENLFTPATTNFDMRALKEVKIIRCGRESERSSELVESNLYQEVDVIATSREEVKDDICTVAFPSYLLHTFHHLHKLSLSNYKAVEVAFEITSPSSREPAHNTRQPLILPYLEELVLDQLECMSHVWKCNWNKFLSLQKQQSPSSFHNLTTIRMEGCRSIKYVFSPLMAKLLSNLKKLHIKYCDDIEEVVSKRDDEDTSAFSHANSTLFPHLDILELFSLTNFNCIGGSAEIQDQLKLSQVSWSLCQYSREMRITSCPLLSSAIPWYAVGQMQKLQLLIIRDCNSMTEVFETQEINNQSGTDARESLPTLEHITMLKLPNLKILRIQGCNLLEHIFTFSTLESLMQLEELEIKDCEAMEVIVKKENGEQTMASEFVVFPRLKLVELVNLPNVMGFFLGKNEFVWPMLEKVVIAGCPQITVFTYGRSTAPKLKFINTSLGTHSFEYGLNFHVTTTSHQSRLPSYESTSSYRPTTMEQFPWSFHNLIEMNVDRNPSGGQSLFSSSKLLQLLKLETIQFRGCRDTEEIFDSQSVVEIPNLRRVNLYSLNRLKCIWKSNQWTVIKCPNLTQLSIQHCNTLEYVFTCSMFGSLLQLQHLYISQCKSLKVIVRGDEECDAIANAVVLLPCLKSLELESLGSLNGFCLGEEAFEFPSLDTMKIEWCPDMTVFTKGDLSTPKLHAIHTRKGKFNIRNRLNSVIKTFTEIKR